jgi:thiamine biosynthesis protein ThiS
MQIKVNGETRDINAPMNVSELAASLGLTPSQVAIERNLQIVPRSTWNEAMVASGDEIEIVRLIGGG